MFLHDLHTNLARCSGCHVLHDPRLQRVASVLEVQSWTGVPVLCVGAAGAAACAVVGMELQCALGLHACYNRTLALTTSLLSLPLGTLETGDLSMSKSVPHAARRLQSGARRVMAWSIQLPVQ